jgi:hypothetical protein
MRLWLQGVWIAALLVLGCSTISRNSVFDPHGSAYAEAVWAPPGAGSYDTVLWDDFSLREADAANADLVKGGFWKMAMAYSSGKVGPFSEDTVRLWDRLGTPVVPFADATQPTLGASYYGGEPDSGIGFSAVLNEYNAGEDWSLWSSGEGWRWGAVGMRVVQSEWQAFPGIGAGFRLDVQVTCSPDIVLEFGLWENPAVNNLYSSVQCRGVRQNISLGVEDFRSWGSTTEPRFENLTQIAMQLKVEPTIDRVPFPEALVGKRLFLTVHKFLLRMPRP